MPDRSSSPIFDCRFALLAALAIRLFAAWLGAALPCHADECWYCEIAAAALAGDGILPNRGHLWPPGYPLFLAAHALFASAPCAAARFTQPFVSTATIVPLATLVGAAFGARAAVLAAWLMAAQPTLIAFSHYLWPETLFLLAFVGASSLVLALRATLRANEAVPVHRPILAGVVYGLACLVKSLPLYFLVLVLPWLALAAPSRRRGLRTAALLLAGVVAALAPWSAYASVSYERLVVLEATLGVNLWRGNNTFLPFDADYGAERPMAGGHPACDEPNPIDRDRCNERQALAFIAADPLSFLTRIPTKMADLWTPSSFLVRHLYLALYGPVPFAIGVVTLDVVAWALLVVGAILGLALPPQDARARDLRSFVLLFVAYVLCVHAMTFGMSRFRLPLYPFFAAFAAQAWVERRRIREAAREPWRLAIVGGALGALAVAWLARLDSIRPPGAG